MLAIAALYVTTHWTDFECPPLTEFIALVGDRISAVSYLRPAPAGGKAVRYVHEFSDTGLKLVTKEIPDSQLMFDSSGQLFVGAVLDSHRQDNSSARRIPILSMISGRISGETVALSDGHSIATFVDGRFEGLIRMEKYDCPFTLGDDGKAVYYTRSDKGSLVLCRSDLYGKVRSQVKVALADGTLAQDAALYGDMFMLSRTTVGVCFRSLDDGNIYFGSCAIETGKIGWKVRLPKLTGDVIAHRMRGVVATRGDRVFALGEDLIRVFTVPSAAQK